MGTPGVSPALPSRLNETTTCMLLQRAKKFGLRRRELLMRQGYSSIQAFLIESGSVLLFRTDDCGAEVALDLLGPGDFCGIEDALCGQPYELSAKATTQTVCYSVSTDAIHEAVATNVSVAMVLIGYIAARLRLAAEHMEILALDSIEKRVKKILQRLVLQTGGHHGHDLQLPITQGDLACLVGGSRQSVNRCLVSLKLLGIVRSHPRYISVSDALAPRAR
jgi:CRP/FNR family transcriptional regulator, cyclic AMP receptor protein